MTPMFQVDGRLETEGYTATFMVRVVATDPDAATAQVIESFSDWGATDCLVLHAVEVAG